MALITGNHTYLCEPQLRGDMNDVIIGNYCSVASGVVFDCGFNHNIKNVTTFPLNKLDSSLPGNIKNRGDITIGNDVTIGEACIILSGVDIGDGAVIGAGTVVRRNIYPYEVYIGEGLPHRRRFEARIWHQLIEIAWWNWPDERVIKNAHLLLSEDIEKFINEHV